MLNMLKKFILCIFFTFMVLFIISCKDNGKEITDIKFNDYEQKQDIDEFSIYDLSFEVTYDDNTVNKVYVTKDMLSKEDLDKLNTIGMHEIKINYLDKVITLNINLTNYYEVTYILDGNIVDTQIVEHGENSTIPDESITNKDGYTFIDWNHNGNNITENTIIIGRYGINKYEVKFIINDLETYEEVRYYNNDEIIDKETFEELERKYNIEIQEVLINDKNYNSDKINKDTIIEINTVDNLSKKTKSKDILPDNEYESYDVCVAFSNSFNFNKIIKSDILSETDLVHFSSYFKNYLVNEKDLFNVYYVIKENKDYIIIQSQVNAEKIYKYSSNLKYKFSHITGWYEEYHNLILEKEVLNGYDSGIYFKFEKGVFQFETVYNDRKFEIDYYKRFYKVYNESESLREYEFSILHHDLGEGKVTLENYLFQERSGRSNAVLFKVKKYINLIGYAEGNVYLKNVKFDDIRWYEVSDESYINTHVGDRSIFIKIRKINGVIDGFAFKDDVINVEANYYMLYQERYFSKYDIKFNDILAIKLSKEEIDEIFNTSDIYCINEINIVSRFYFIENIENILYIKVISGTLEEEKYKSVIENHFGEFYETLKDFIMSDISFETKNDKIIYYSYISLDNIKDLYN